jgi:RimJ/RimL family protein N-acetyltransferase
VIWPPPRKPLVGSIVRLEPLEPAHREPMSEASADPEIWTWMDRTVPGDAAAFGRWFDERLAASSAATEWCFATLWADGGEVIGSSSYLAIRPEHDGLEIGWTWLVPSAWRTGANVEAKLLMLGFAFEDLGAQRVEFKTDARNQRSRDALAALPAVFEGIFRKHMKMRGIGVRDSAFFSILDDEWPGVRANLESRLAAHPAAAASES